MDEICRIISDACVIKKYFLITILLNRYSDLKWVNKWANDFNVVHSDPTTELQIRGHSTSEASWFIFLTKTLLNRKYFKQIIIFMCYFICIIIIKQCISYIFVWKIAFHVYYQQICWLCCTRRYGTSDKTYSKRTLDLYFKPQINVVTSKLSVDSYKKYTAEN